MTTKKMNTIRRYISSTVKKTLATMLAKLSSWKVSNEDDNMMTEQQIGSILAEQLMATIRNSDQSYISTVGAQFCHLKDPGKQLMAELVELMFIKAVECDKQRRQQDAEQLVMENLKK
jgi:hypothetical protein